MQKNESNTTNHHFIDEHIADEIDITQLAALSGYSESHFSHCFSEQIGIPPQAYVTWRKLQFAANDLSNNERITEVAMKYGFETHAGFAKAFKHCFHFPPSLIRMLVGIQAPARASAEALSLRFKGGKQMTPHIMEVTPFPIVGYPKRYHRANVKTTADVPTFWASMNIDYGFLSKLYEVFPKSKHCEISMCYDVDEASGDFTYIIGRAVDIPTELASIEPDMTAVEIPGGLYAIFSTPPCDSNESRAPETWNRIFLEWLPESEFAYDDTRNAFEYEDLRSHGVFFGGKVQMDLYVPIRKK